MTVYDLSETEQELHAALWGLDSENPDDALEIERLTNKLDETNLIKSQKIEWRVRLIKELECSAVGAKEREKAAIRKRVSAENAVERMKQNLIYTMDVLGVEKIELEDFNVSISNSNPALEIADDFDLRRLPLSCYKIVPEHYEPNKVEIKKYLKDNELNIKGLTLIQKPSLRIR